jgi:hypothetical protein
VAPGSSTQLLHEEDKPTFAKIPLALGSFPGKLKTALVCNVKCCKLVYKGYEINQGFMLIIKGSKCFILSL